MERLRPREQPAPGVVDGERDLKVGFADAGMRSKRSHVEVIVTGADLALEVAACLSLSVAFSAHTRALVHVTVVVNTGCPPNTEPTVLHALAAAYGSSVW
jgi:hypothetical protein